MVNSFGRVTRWNIFARELEDVLAERGLRLSHLDDRGIVNHREKVRRLQHSLLSPKHLTTLNPAEMDRLIVEMQLTDMEQKRVLAALLATSVEMTLLDRTEPEVALMAADNVFAILFAAMKAQPDMFVTTSIRAGGMIDEDESFGDTFFAQALDLLDRATLSLHAGRNATSREARMAHAYEALANFNRTLELLNQSRSPHPDSERRRCWYAEASDGYKMAERLVQSVGGEKL